MKFRTPNGSYYTLYADIADQPHALIAGATGSGKSVVLNGIISTLLYKSPAQAQFILLDPKRVELIDYKFLPHTLEYATEPDECCQALKHALDIIESRYRLMQKSGLKKFIGSNVYVIIDELADLMTTCKKRFAPLLQRIAQIGRAAAVHAIVATQCPLSSVISTPIKVNFDCRLGLRTRNRQDSRNILDTAGCETLPRYGEGLYLKPEGLQHVLVPMVSSDEIQRLVSHWIRQKGFFSRIFKK